MDFVRFLIFLTLPTLALGLAVMSIDYGGEYVKIAIVKPGVPMEIVLNKESQRKTAAIVFLRNDERTFGDAALNSAIRYPSNGYRHMHQLLGKHFDDPLVQRFRQRHPYYTLINDTVTGTPHFQHDPATVYSPEELVAMVLQKCKEYAESFAEQPISEAVITVPAYYNQAERRAMLRAADLAGLKVLQLLNDNAAVALNYGIFRRKAFNTTSTYYMFFDVGAVSTTASVVEYHITKHKSTAGYVDTYPQLVVRGVGYDRSLGGMEMQYRLQEHLANQFNKMKKKGGRVQEDHKAMQKLYKEAGRVMQVLSANTFHFAQVESLMNDEDFRVKVTREEFEEMCKDLFERIEGVVKEALRSSQVTLNEISEVVLMGGGTRIPRIQEVLKHHVQRQELGKGINTDEAAALGAVYQAAHLGMGFKVQKFSVKDCVLFPVQVSFERVLSEGEEGEEYHRTIHRTLFSKQSHLATKKSMTFNKHTSDFHFIISYADLSFLTPQQLKDLGTTTLANVTLTGVDDAFIKRNGTLSKGVKAHFKMDENALLQLEGVEVIFEDKDEEKLEEESTLSKLGKSFSKFFGGGGEEGAEVVEDKEEEKKEEADKQEAKDDKKDESDKKTDEKKKEEKVDTKGDKKDKKEDKDKKEETETKKDTDNKNTTTTPEKKKILTIKEKVNAKVRHVDVVEPSEEAVAHARKHLTSLKKKDDEKAEMAKVKNEIESFLFLTRDKLEEEIYKECSTEEEREKLHELCSLSSDWLDELPDNAPKKEYDTKLLKLKEATKDLEYRVLEKKERPVFMEALNDRFNQSQFFLSNMLNYTGEGQIFTQVEFDTLEKLLNNIKEWNTTTHEAQSKLAHHEAPVLTLQDISAKITELEREINYLIAKVKNYQAKIAKEAEEAAKKETSKKKKKKKAKKEDGDEDLKEEEEVEEETKKEEKKEDMKKEDDVKKKDDVKKEDLDQDYLEIESTADTKATTTEKTTTQKHPEHDGGEL